MPKPGMRWKVAEIIKGYEVSKGDYIELEPEELEAVAHRKQAYASKSTSSSRRPTSTNSTCAIHTLLYLTAKLASKRSP